MVFYCRCFSFSFEEEEEEEEDETATQIQSSSTQTFYTASSNYSSSQAAKVSVFSDHIRVFAFSELKAATNDFSPSAKIGEGGFGCVYMGVIKNHPDSTKTLNVAVRKLGPIGLQGHKEWVTEVNGLGVVEHPNLVKLFGYCTEDDGTRIQRLLVYEYMCNGSVEDHLSTRSKTPLSWTKRLKVAQDAARGLAYLHEQMDFQIILRDFKSSNILLDDQCNAKVSDFGLAQLCTEEGLTYVSTAVVGTMGYTAPEYITTGQLTSMGNVWSYGVFLYELITGRRPLDTSRPKNEQKLLEWVTPYIDSKRLELIIDPRLEDGNYSLESVQKMSFIASRCLSKDPKSRPKMSKVLEMVNQLITGFPSQTLHLKNMVPVVTIEPKMVRTHAKKTNENVKNEGKTGSSEVQHKEHTCFSRICCVQGSK